MIPPERLLTSHTLSEEKKLDRSTRPIFLKDYLGQKTVREQMALFIEAAKKSGTPLDHTLIAGPPGLGKTTLAHIIAQEMGGVLKTTSGPVIDKAGDLAALLTHLEPNDVLFIDEIHRLTPAIEEILYPALEDYQLDILIGEGRSARSIKLDLAPFTLVGATTRTGLLTSPLRDRFGITQQLRFYSMEELAAIVHRSAAILNIPIVPEGARVIAERSRGTPRIANRLLRRVNDFCVVKNHSTIDGSVAKTALNFLEVDQQGLDQQDRVLLLTLIHKFNGGPVGLESLSATLGEMANTIEEVIEPFLLQEGLIIRTRRGRVASAKTYRHFNLDPPSALLEWRQMNLGDIHEA